MWLLAAAIVAVAAADGGVTLTPAQRAHAMLANMNLTEKLTMVHGADVPFVYSVRSLGDCGLIDTFAIICCRVLRDEHSGIGITTLETSLVVLVRTGVDVLRCRGVVCGASPVNCCGCITWMLPR